MFKNLGHLSDVNIIRIIQFFHLFFRDLGSSLRNLHVMWASRCCLLELDGISSMCNLKELYLSYNEISDISPLSMLDQIEILDLEG